MVRDLLHGGAGAEWGDTSFMRQDKVIREKTPRALDLIQKRDANYRKLSEEGREKNSSGTPAQVNHVFYVAKYIFEYRKVHYKGLSKYSYFIYVLLRCRTLIWSGGICSRSLQDHSIPG